MTNDNRTLNIGNCRGNVHCSMFNCHFSLKAPTIPNFSNRTASGASDPTTGGGNGVLIALEKDTSEKPFTRIAGESGVYRRLRVVVYESHCAGHGSSYRIDETNHSGRRPFLPG